MLHLSISRSTNGGPAIPCLYSEILTVREIEILTMLRRALKPVDAYSRAGSTGAPWKLRSNHSGSVREDVSGFANGVIAIETLPARLSQTPNSRLVIVGVIFGARSATYPPPKGVLERSDRLARLIVSSKKSFLASNQGKTQTPRYQ
jgi:hypothetical protein